MVLMVRSAATPRISNHVATDCAAITIPFSGKPPWNRTCRPWRDRHRPAGAGRTSRSAKRAGTSSARSNLFRTVLAHPQAHVLSGGMNDALSIARTLLRCPSVPAADAGALGVLETTLKAAGFAVPRVT